MSTQPISESLDFNSPFDLLLPWGRFNPVRLKIDRDINLTKDTFTVGRAKECDFSIEPGQIENEMFYHISNIQFRVERRKFREKVFVAILEDLSSNGTYCNGVLVGKNQKIVLSDNDSIAIAKKNFNETSSGNFGNSVASEYPQEIRKVYAVYELLGRGGYGEVRFAVKKDTVQCVALKIIRTEPVERRHVIDALTEVKVLQKIKHKNIVELYNVVILGNEMYITLEFMPGGDFAHYIINKERLLEEQTKFIFYQIFEGVNYLHTQNIIHRDLKPANILLSDDSDYPIMKITDFGLSKIMEKHVAPVHTQCGTRSFAAPELQFSGVSRTYDYRADVWSLGVMMFLSLSGVLPFSNKRNDMAFETQINQASFTFEPSHVWKEISSQARNIIKKCLISCPQKRWHVWQILNDKWITEDGKLKTLIQNFTEKSDKENAVAEPVAKKNRLF